MHIPRLIRYQGNFSCGDFTVKLYTISKKDDFDFKASLDAVKSHLPAWLSLENGFNNEHDNQAFLILHQGTEGIFNIINKWVGGNMLDSHIFFSEHSSPTSFKEISGKGLNLCIWELEVVRFERDALIEHVLKPEKPDLGAYLGLGFTGWY